LSVTVVIATRDRRARLLHTLGRLAALPERPPVVVVDNGSRDGSPAAVRDRHPEVVVLEPGENLGPAARTLGARSARTPFIAFSDDDSWWAPDALARGAALMTAHRSLGLVAGRILVEPGGAVDPTCHLMRESPLPRVGAHPQVLGFVACGTLVRRSAFLQVGGFSPRLPIGGEEALLAIDLFAAGWKLVYADDVVAHHRPAAGGRNGRRQRELRNALWTAWLRRPAASARARTADALRDAGRAAPATFAAALAGLPWVLAERRVVAPATEAALRAVERHRHTKASST
jgi:N-acetylglucosaminyl-diphospho-decaprenol L-rhamnosyltransferase